MPTNVAQLTVAELGLELRSVCPKALVWLDTGLGVFQVLMI